MTEPQRCKELVSRQFGWKLGECGRPVKGEWEGVGMCGIHLAAKRRSQENHAAFEQKRAESQALAKAARGLCDKLSAHGIFAKPHYVSRPSVKESGHTGGIVLEAHAAEYLLKLLGEGR